MMLNHFLSTITVRRAQDWITLYHPNLHISKPMGSREDIPLWVATYI